MTSTPEPKSCCSSQPPETENKDLGLSAYAPLFVILFAAALGAAARHHTELNWSWHIWMHDFMGLFLLVFAMVKLFDLSSFATGFAKYDLLAARSRTYALVYPFLELGLRPNHALRSNHVLFPPKGGVQHMSQNVNLYNLSPRCQDDDALAAPVCLSF